ncbi:MAG: ABC transporter ATP-binding protein [Actinomycetota bacterium]
MAERPIAVEVKDLHKSFRIPSHRVMTLKERAVHPFTRVEYTTLHALRGVSFRVAEGELMGIAGRNGSGKTTLLKLLASIYRADRGQIRIAGTLAPFVELGVGFNPNLSARENVHLNGVMMGMTPREARNRFDKVIEFAELEEFVEMKLKNYSSGMLMRLAFSMMTEADADLMLIDEVLAVGDARFGQKCVDTLERMRKEGRTILFVTHAMESLKSLCDRAILIEDGILDMDDDPEEVAQRYLQLNFSGPARAASATTDGPRVAAASRIGDVWLENSDGERTRDFDHGSPIHLVAQIDVKDEIEQPGFGFEIRASDRARVFAVLRQPIRGSNGKLQPGERVRIKATIENPLAPDSYAINCSLWRGTEEDLVDVRHPAAELVVRGDQQLGYVELDWELDCEVESERPADPMEATPE